MIHYSGLNICQLQLVNGHKKSRVFDNFLQTNIENISDLTIGWNYFLAWKGTNVFLYGIIDGVEKKQLLTIPETVSTRFCCGIAGKTAITLLSIDHEIWQYKLYENIWTKVHNFIPSNDDAIKEYVIKIVENRTIVALTNLGRVFNVPTLVEMPKRVKYVDIVCGFEHTLLLANNGDIYSMGIGSRGQLGHGDLEDYNEPKLIEALAGLQVVQIAAAGWHNAVLTSDGDLYTWGWNTNGELGVIDEQKVIAIPTIVNFSNELNDTCDVKIKKVQCGNAFTICISDDQSIWGCGSNKYGQLGQNRSNFLRLKKFVKLEVNLNDIIDIKCQEWGTIIKSS
ncbi:hypothetical protein PV327_001167 [Microctonus hyperodae]|uniref:RCC1 domain-containing protein 1 n=1 Tax=Microctonus hyperodae TaxID=165561 RepID=A0AA39G7Q7_MICHY|nr:hypothetical protein PV327_001167 [Microctonus hyperodae]